VDSFESSGSRRAASRAPVKVPYKSRLGTQSRAGRTNKVAFRLSRNREPASGCLIRPYKLGGSERPDEVRTVIARNLGISDAEQSEPLPSGVQTRFENQVHWARFYLAKAG
jgi:Mrr N-terminal domain